MINVRRIIHADTVRVTSTNYLGDKSRQHTPLWSRGFNELKALIAGKELTCVLHHEQSACLQTEFVKWNIKLKINNSLFQSFSEAIEKKEE